MPDLGPGGVETLTYVGLAALVVFALYGLSLRWVWHDARCRDADPRLAVLFAALVCWPLSLAVWWLARKEIHLAPKGGGSAWG